MRTESEQGLGEESIRLFEGSDQDWEEQPLPDGPMTVGIDGGFVRAAHKEGWFEVIAGKSVVAFRREENDETPSTKRFGFVQTYTSVGRCSLTGVVALRILILRTSTNTENPIAK